MSIFTHGLLFKNHLLQAGSDTLGRGGCGQGESVNLHMHSFWFDFIRKIIWSLWAFSALTAVYYCFLPVFPALPPKLLCRPPPGSGDPICSFCVSGSAAYIADFFHSSFQKVCWLKSHFVLFSSPGEIAIHQVPGHTCQGAGLDSACW